MKHPAYYEIVDTRAKMQDMVAHVAAAPRIGLDTESSGPNLIKYKGGKEVDGNMVNMFHPATTLTCCTVATPSRSFMVPLGHTRGVNLPISLWNGSQGLLEALMRHPRVWIHNVPHEMKALGLRERPKGWYDTILLAWVTGQTADGELGLKALAPHHLGWRMSNFRQVVGDGVFSELTPEQGKAYAIEDAIAALQLADKLIPLLDKLSVKQVFLDEMSFVECFNEMECNGQDIDRERVEQLEDKLRARDKVLYREWCQIAPNRKVDGVWQQTVPQMHMPPITFGRWTGKSWAHTRKKYVTPAPLSPSSSPQLQHLFDLGVWQADKMHPRTRTNALSVGKAGLEHIIQSIPEGSQGYELAEILLEKKAITKNLSAFTRGFIVAAENSIDGRIHPSYLQHGTQTGRASCSNPNLQQVPSRTEAGKEIRACFV